MDYQLTIRISQKGHLSINETYKNDHKTQPTEKVRPSLYERPFPKIPADVEKQEAVKQAFLHAWNGYSQYCWGKDELRPESNTCNNYLNAGLTIIDSLSTLKIMGLETEFAKAREFVANDFHPHGHWSIFEFMIRFVGGFLSAYDLSGDKIFLDRAVDAGDAIYQLIDKDSGFFGSNLDISFSNGHLRASGGSGYRVLAEVGTYQLEFTKLSQYTGDPKYIEIAMKVYKIIWRANPRNVLVSSVRGETTNLHVGAGLDSYFEYIIKEYILTGGTSEIMLKQHIKLMGEIRSQISFTTYPSKYVGVGVKSHSVYPMMEHLATFIAGSFSVGSVKKNPNSIEDLKFASSLVETFHAAQQSVQSKLMAERMRYNTINRDGVPEFQIDNDEYLLRPETVESIYYLWKFTGLPKYREYAWDFFQGIEKSCKTNSGFSRVSQINATTTIKKNLQDSFFLAETLKYLYLTFSDSSLLSPDEWVFNTEAHPLKVMDEETAKKWAPYVELSDVAEIIKQARDK